MGSGECTCPVAETDVAIGGAFKICIQGEGDQGPMDITEKLIR